MAQPKWISKLATQKARNVLFYATASLVFLYAFTIPMFGGREKWNYIMYGIMALLGCCVIIHAILFKEIVKFKRWQYWFFPIFVVFALIGTLVSSHQYRLWVTLLILVISVLVLMQAFVILRNENLILILVSAGIFCFSLYFIYYYRTDIIHFSAFTREGFRLGFDFDNPNVISAICSIGCFGSLYLTLFWKSKWKYIFLLPLFAIGLAGVSTGSRTFIVAILVIAVSLLFFKFKKHKLLMLFIIVAAIILFIVIINLPFAQTIKNRFERFFDTFFNSCELLAP